MRIQNSHEIAYTISATSVSYHESTTLLAKNARYRYSLDMATRVEVLTFFLPSLHFLFQKSSDIKTRDHNTYLKFRKMLDIIFDLLLN